MKYEFNITEEEIATLFRDKLSSAIGDRLRYTDFQRVVQVAVDEAIRNRSIELIREHMNEDEWLKEMVFNILKKKIIRQIDRLWINHEQAVDVALLALQRSLERSKES